MADATSSENCWPKFLNMGILRTTSKARRIAFASSSFRAATNFS
eukprot:CAMPEP_0119511032 /NCGR_PEP_ID=MMETSP1344-20130328/29818_1 /TAXON_ID=236787 /ORGANISM="Florenciella parvula, Strain CCMP2471" /LENGTH=43 /DNA_ID= /DNA_START= /DNA_END= /DNA_ORIENTATION=